MEPRRWGLDFAFIAVFAALTLSLWQGRDDFLPWLVAAVLAVAGERLLPGKLYIAWEASAVPDGGHPGYGERPKTCSSRR